MVLHIHTKNKNLIKYDVKNIFFFNINILEVEYNNGIFEDYILSNVIYFNIFSD